MQKLLFIFLSQLILGYSNLYAQLENLDTSFNHNGILPINMGSNSNSTDLAYAVALQIDGKIVIAGYTWTGSVKKFALARCTAEGILDKTFDNDGIVTTSVDKHSVVQSIAIQPDGKIIAVGSSQVRPYDGFLLARYNTDGSLDNSFGSGGKLITTISGDEDGPRSVILQTDGKIVVGGYSGNDQLQDFALARYDSNGTLDTAFSKDGIQITSFNNSEPDGITSMALQPDGKIIVTGYSYLNGIPNFALARYNTNGSLDETFDADGKLTTVLDPQGSEAWSLAIQNDRKIVVGGTCGAFSKSNFAIVRYNTNGSLDSTFGINGRTITDIDSSDTIFSLALWPDGRIVAAGTSYNDTVTVFSIAQYNSNGIIDSTFGNNGVITNEIAAGNCDLRGLCLQPNGKVVVAGDAYYGTATNWDFVLIRYLTNLNVGVIEFNPSNSSLLIYPNPIKSEAELNFKLIKNETLSLRLFDMQGHLVQTFYSNQFREAGQYKDKLLLNSSLPSNMYVLELNNGSGNTILRIVKD